MPAEAFEIAGHTCPASARQGTYTKTSHDKDFSLCTTEGLCIIAPFFFHVLAIGVQNSHAVPDGHWTAKSFTNRVGMGILKEVVQVGCAEVVRAFLGHGPRAAWREVDGGRSFPPPPKSKRTRLRVARASHHFRNNRKRKDFYSLGIVFGVAGAFPKHPNQSQHMDFQSLGMMLGLARAPPHNQNQRTHVQCTV